VTSSEQDTSGSPVPFARGFQGMQPACLPQHLLEEPATLQSRWCFFRCDALSPARGALGTAQVEDFSRGGAGDFILGGTRTATPAQSPPKPRCQGL